MRRTGIHPHSNWAERKRGKGGGGGRNDKKKKEPGIIAGVAGFSLGLVGKTRGAGQLQDQGRTANGGGSPTTLLGAFYYWLALGPRSGNRVQFSGEFDISSPG